MLFRSVIGGGQVGVVGTVIEEQQRLGEVGTVERVLVIYDDRRKVSPGVKFKDAELIGVPTIVIVGKGLEAGTIEIKDRASGDRREVPVDQIVAAVISEVRGEILPEVQGAASR